MERTCQCKDGQVIDCPECSYRRSIESLNSLNIDDDSAEFNDEIYGHGLQSEEGEFGICEGEHGTELAGSNYGEGGSISGIEDTGRHNTLPFDTEEPFSDIEGPQPAPSSRAESSSGTDGSFEKISEDMAVGALERPCTLQLGDNTGKRGQVVPTGDDGILSVRHRAESEKSVRGDTNIHTVHERLQERNNQDPQGQPSGSKGYGGSSSRKRRSSIRKSIQRDRRILSEQKSFSCDGSDDLWDPDDPAEQEPDSDSGGDGSEYGGLSDSSEESEESYDDDAISYITDAHASGDEVSGSSYDRGDQRDADLEDETEATKAVRRFLSEKKETAYSTIFYAYTTGAGGGGGGGGGGPSGGSLWTPKFKTNKKGKRIIDHGRRGRPSPQFIIASHTSHPTPHYHLYYHTSQPQTSVRSAERIGEYLQVTPQQMITIKTAIITVRNKLKMLYYLLQYGISSIITFGNYWDGLEELLQHLAYVPRGEANCMNPFRDIGKYKRKIKDGPTRGIKIQRIQYQDMIKKRLLTTCKYPYSVLQFKKKAEESEMLMLLTDLGTQWDQFVEGVAKILNQVRENNREECYMNIITSWIKETIGDTLHIRPITQQWLTSLFAANNIDKINFISDFITIFDKEESKINALVLQGPPNCFKSQILRMLLAPVGAIPMTRTTADNNSFWLQPCIGKRAILFEEPYILPARVNDWKLLLEGADITANIKNKDATTLERVPFFITTNASLTVWLGGEDAAAMDRRHLRYRFLCKILDRTTGDGADPYSETSEYAANIPECPLRISDIELIWFFLGKTKKMAEARVRMCKNYKENDEQLTTHACYCLTTSPVQDGVHA